MEKLVQIIISDDAQTHENQPPVIINPTMAILVPFIPTNYSLALTILTTGINFKEVTKVTIDMLACNPKNMKHRLVFHNEIPTEIFEQAFVDDVMTNINLNLRNLPFKESGKFRVEFTVDDQIFTHEFIVKEKADE